MIRFKLNLAHWLFLIISLGPLIASIGISFMPAASALWTALSFQTIYVRDAETFSELDKQQIKSSIQNHFSKNNLYIPMQDIVIESKDLSDKNQVLSHMEKICGQGLVYVWVPLLLRLPFYGEKVFEWCWKPKVSLE